MFSKHTKDLVKGLPGGWERYDIGGLQNSPKIQPLHL